MAALVQVSVHSSVFPESVRRELLGGLRRRCIHPKFHYTSYKQAQKWLALHDAYSPSRTDPGCLALYDRSYQSAVEKLPPGPVRLIGLGCGGGQKEARLLNLLAGQGRGVFYAPCDISVALVLTSTLAAQAAAPRAKIDPLVCDLTAADDLPDILNQQEGESGIRLVTLFGMMPNFEPEIIMPRLAALIRPDDFLLFSANLAPGPDYADGVQRALPGYNNPLSSDWLLTFFYDLGVEQGDGSLRFSVEDSQSGLKRIAADFCFAQPRTLTIDGELFKFGGNDKIRLFFSYRYTPDRIVRVFAEHGLSILEQWISDSGEEGIFLCRR